MAKIYQTQDDFERDHVGKAMHGVQCAESMAAGVTGLGIAALIAGFIKKNPVVETLPQDAGFWKKTWSRWQRPIGGSHLKWVGAATTIVGGLGVYFLQKTIDKGQARLDVLGPEEVVLPPNVDVIDGKYVARLGEEKSCGCAKGRII